MRDSLFDHPDEGDGMDLYIYRERDAPSPSQIDFEMARLAALPATTLQVGVRVRLLVRTAWWLTNGRLEYVPAGALGTIYQAVVPFDEFDDATMLAIRFDEFPHPKPGGHCGMSGNVGDPIPDWLEAIL